MSEFPFDEFNEELRRRVAFETERNEQRHAAEVERRRTEIEGPPLRRAIRDWYCGMKWEGRCRGYTMEELATLFATPPNILGPVLMEMGFQRKRDWSNGQARRYWVNEDCFYDGRTPGKPERR